jgi:hypothetical protein
VLASAQLRGTLHKFIVWFKRKKQPVMMDMAEERGPKNAKSKATIVALRYFWYKT